MIALIVVLWFVVGVINYGLLLAYYTTRYPAFNHRRLVVALFVGPVGLLTTLITGQYTTPLRFKPYTEEQRWEAHQRLWPSLSRKYFERID